MTRSERTVKQLEDCQRANDSLARAIRGLLAVENNNWPNYVRQAFAQARAALAQATTTTSERT